MQGNTHLHSRYRPHTTASMYTCTYHGTYVHRPTLSVRTIIAPTCSCTYVRTYHKGHTITYHNGTLAHIPGTTGTYNVMSQLSDWKRAHMCTENHVYFGRYCHTYVHGPTPIVCQYTCTYVHVYHWYSSTMVHVCVPCGTMVQHYFKNDLKYKHSVPNEYGPTFAIGQYCNVEYVPCGMAIPWYHAS
jgi:hypothetical protein